MTTTQRLRHLMDWELEAAGWTTGEIRLVRRVLAKKANTVTERRIAQRYQALRREVIKREEEREAAQAEYMDKYGVVYYGPDELELIPHAQERVDSIVLRELWAVVYPHIPFYGVKHSYDRHAKDGRYGYYVIGDFWSTKVPQMYTKNGRLCRQGAAAAHRRAGGPGYDYATPKVGSVLSRLNHGQPVFVGEAG